MSGAVKGLPRKLTVEEYSKLQDVPGFRDELIEGERVLSPLARFQYAVVIDNLEALLKQQFPEMMVVRETGWHFRSAEGVDSVPGPDLMVITKADYLHAAKSTGYFFGHPEFVVEVISPSERKARRLQKAGLYLEAGAGAVVEVDYTRRFVIVHHADREVAEMLLERMNWPFQAAFTQLFRNLD